MTHESTADRPRSVQEVVEAWDGQDREALVQAIFEREDKLGDLLRIAGTNFGLYPQIVAEVIAEVGLGTPIDSDTRTHIRQQFVALMQQLRNQQQGNN